MLDRSPYNPTAYDDDWEDQPAQSGFHKWGMGVALPVCIGYFSLMAIVSQQATFVGERSSMILHGRNAVAFGIAWLSASIFLHCHYYWGNIYDQAWPAVLGKILSAIGFIAGLGFVLVRVGIYGMQ